MGLFTQAEELSNTPEHETSAGTGDEITPTDNTPGDVDNTPDHTPAGDPIPADGGADSTTTGETTTTIDPLHTQLHTALVKLDGRLANPDDLPFNPDHLTDEAALTQAITDLLATRPGLAARHVTGDVGQGARGGTTGPVDLIELMRRA